MTTDEGKIRDVFDTIEANFYYMEQADDQKELFSHDNEIRTIARTLLTLGIIDSEQWMQYGNRRMAIRTNKLKVA